MSKHPGGRPKKYTNEEDLAKDIDRYFKEETKPTLSGLAYFLDMDRQTLYNYAKDEQFFDTIKKARNRMVNLYEQWLLHNPKDKSITGIIFALKNWGWSDKTDITSGGEKIKPILGGISDDSNTSDNKAEQAPQEN